MCCCLSGVVLVRSVFEPDWLVEGSDGPAVSFDGDVHVVEAGPADGPLAVCDGGCVRSAYRHGTAGAGCDNELDLGNGVESHVATGYVLCNSDCNAISAGCAAWGTECPLGSLCGLVLTGPSDDLVCPALTVCACPVSDSFEVECFGSEISCSDSVLPEVSAEVWCNWCDVRHSCFVGWTDSRNALSLACE